MTAKLNEEQLRIVISVDEDESVDLILALGNYTSDLLNNGYPNRAKRIHEMLTLLTSIHCDLIDATK